MPAISAITGPAEKVTVMLAGLSLKLAARAA